VEYSLLIVSVALISMLIICFLPAIFAFTLGPILFKVFQAVEPVIRNPFGR
jgi:hypothetical protein